MKTKRESIKGYKINFTTNTIIMNYKFAKACQDYGSAEYKLMIQIKADFPMMTVVTEAGRKVTSTNVKKRLTYKNIEKHIMAYSNADELLNTFELAIQLSKPLASPYKYVCDWFYAQFPDYDNPVKALSNTYYDVKLVDLPDTNKYQKKESFEA